MDIIVINNKSVDIDLALPLTMGDFRNLQRNGVDVTNIKPSDFDTQCKYVFFILTKANKEITMEDIDTIEPMAFASLVTRINKNINKEVPRPLENTSM